MDYLYPAWNMHHFILPEIMEIDIFVFIKPAILDKWFCLLCQCKPFFQFRFLRIRHLVVECILRRQNRCRIRLGCLNRRRCRCWRRRRILAVPVSIGDLSRIFSNRLRRPGKSERPDYCQFRMKTDRLFNTRRYIDQLTIILRIQAVAKNRIVRFFRNLPSENLGSKG